MKGIESWIWIIGGLILAMILIGIALNIIYSISLQQDKNLAEMEFSKIVGVVNSLCDSNVGQEATHNFRFPEIVEKIYASYDKNFRNDSYGTKGNNLCINFSELRCVKLDCALSLPLIKRKENLLTFVDRIIGKRVFYEYSINFVRREEGVFARSTLTHENQTTIEFPTIYDFETLIEFNYNPILIRKNNVIIFLDITPWIEKDKNIIKILENICNSYGKRIAIFWEDSCVWNKKNLDDGSIWCPPQNEVDINNNEIIMKLREKGCSIDAILHEKSIMSHELQSYDQVWLLRPGWCEPTRSTMDFCINSIPWNYIEIREIKNYIENGGKLVVFLDYSPNINLKIANAILSNLNFYAKIIDGNPGRGKATKIYESNITRGIDNYEIFGVAIIRPGK